MERLRDSELALLVASAFVASVAACSGDEQRTRAGVDASAVDGSSRAVHGRADGAVMDAEHRAGPSRSTADPSGSEKDASTGTAPGNMHVQDAGADADASNARAPSDAATSRPFPPPTQCPSHLDAGATLFETTKGLIPYTSVQPMNATGHFGPDDIVLSRNGDIVAGYFVDENPSDPRLSSPGRWFRWRAKTFSDLGSPLGSAHGRVLGIDCDGSTMVGTDNRADLQAPSAPYRWRLADGFSRLQTSSDDAFAFAVSADGSVVIGGATDATNQAVPLLWKNDEPPLTLFTMHLDDPIVNGLSADGTMVGGVLFNTAPVTVGIWRTDGTLLAWGRQAGTDAPPAAVSALDASGTVLLVAYGWGPWVSFVWNQRDGFTPLPIDCTWRQMSALGRVVVGTGATGIDDCIWDSKYGLRHLSTLLRSLGKDLPDTFALELTAISDDARVMAGVLHDSSDLKHTDAFRAVLPVSVFE